MGTDRVTMKAVCKFLCLTAMFVAFAISSGSDLGINACASRSWAAESGQRRLDHIGEAPHCYEWVAAYGMSEEELSPGQGGDEEPEYDAFVIK